MIDCSDRLTEYDQGHHDMRDLADGLLLHVLLSGTQSHSLAYLSGAFGRASAELALSGKVWAAAASSRGLSDAGHAAVVVPDRRPRVVGLVCAHAAANPGDVRQRHVWPCMRRRPSIRPGCRPRHSSCCCSSRCTPSPVIHTHHSQNDADKFTAAVLESCCAADAGNVVADVFPHVFAALRAQAAAAALPHDLVPLASVRNYPR